MRLDFSNLAPTGVDPVIRSFSVVAFVRKAWCPCDPRRFLFFSQIADLQRLWVMTFYDNCHVAYLAQYATHLRFRQPRSVLSRGKTSPCLPVP